jgi:ADP-heptose:LPS heptosyltransferase
MIRREIVPLTLRSCASSSLNVVRGAIRRLHVLALGAWLRASQGGPLISVIRCAGIGDIICTFPAVMALRERYPLARIVYVTNRPYVSLVRMSGCADAVIGRDYSSYGVLRGRADAKGLRPWCQAIFQPLFFDEGGPDFRRMHLIDAVSAQLGVEPADRQPHLSIPQDLRARLCGKIAAVRGDAGPVIGLQTGPTWPVKHWPQERWDDLAAVLKSRLGATLIQFGADVSTAAGPERATRVKGTLDWVGSLTLEETVAAIGECDLFIGIDSGLLHIAGAVGTPCVGVFGPLDPERIMAPVTPHLGVAAKLDCIGCHHRTPKLHWQTNCPYDILCMRMLDSESVFDACAEVLTRVQLAVPPSLGLG